MQRSIGPKVDLNQNIDLGSSSIGVQTGTELLKAFAQRKDTDPKTEKALGGIRELALAQIKLRNPSA